MVTVNPLIIILEETSNEKVIWMTSQLHISKWAEY